MNRDSKGQNFSIADCLQATQEVIFSFISVLYEIKTSVVYRPNDGYGERKVMNR